MRQPGVRFLQFDGIRALAVILVILHHWTAWGRAADLGNLGVQFFFVLSGFLITSILLDLRAHLQRGGLTFWEAFKNFQIDRIFRIWPIYFLTLFAVTLAGHRFEDPGAIPMHMVFASNVLFVLRDGFETTLAHFWTLSVEFQFYLAWPFAVLLLGKGRLELLTLALVISAPIFRLLMVSNGFENFAAFNTLPFANMDSLGIGALIAQWQCCESENSTRREALFAYSAIIAFVAFVALRILQVEIANIEQTAYAVIFGWIVNRARTGFTGSVGYILRFPALTWIGLISYGIYVYHMFIPRTLGSALRFVDAPASTQSGLPFFLLSLGTVLILASASWLLIERPIMDHRRTLRRQRSAHGF